MTNFQHAVKNFWEELISDWPPKTVLITTLKGFGLFLFFGLVGFAFGSIGNDISFWGHMLRTVMWFGFAAGCAVGVIFLILLVGFARQLYSDGWNVGDRLYFFKAEPFIPALAVHNAFEDRTKMQQFLASVERHAGYPLETAEDIFRAMAKYLNEGKLEEHLSDEVTYEHIAHYLAPDDIFSLVKRGHPLGQDAGKAWFFRHFRLVITLARALKVTDPVQKVDDILFELAMKNPVAFLNLKELKDEDFIRRRLGDAEFAGWVTTLLENKYTLMWAPAQAQHLPLAPAVEEMIIDIRRGQREVPDRYLDNMTKFAGLFGHEITPQDMVARPEEESGIKDIFITED